MNYFSRIFITIAVMLVFVIGGCSSESGSEEKQDSDSSTATQGEHDHDQDDDASHGDEGEESKN